MFEERKKFKTVYAAFATQKGGAGKTTVCMQTAAMISALTDHKVAVIDLDPQLSLSNKREREWDELTGQTNANTVNAKAYLTLRGKNREKFDVFQLNIFPGDKNQEGRLLIEAEQKIEALRERGEYEIIFLDLPGFTALHQIIKVLSHVDYLFVPFYVDDQTIESGMAFLNAMVQMQNSGATKIKKITAYFWRFAKKTNVKEFGVIQAALNDANIMLMENKVYDSKDIERFRSTINPYDLAGEKSHKPFVDELLKIVGVTK